MSSDLPRARSARSALPLLFALALAGCPGPTPEAPDAGCAVPCGTACCAAGQTCDEGTTTCTGCAKQCDGKQCGPDGCNGTCGDCTGGQMCTPSGQCVAPYDAGQPPLDAGAATPDAGPIGSPVSFKVMSWNVHDFFTTTKASSIAKVVNKQSPDLLALQEVGTKDLLGTVNNSLSKKLPYYELIPSDDPRGINVALMSAYPLVKVQSHKDERLFTPDGRGPYYFSRDCLEVHVDVGGNRRVAVLVNHQISQLDSSVDTDFKRLAQAARTREIADQIRRETPWTAVVITGDMNDDPTTPPLNVFFSDGAYVDFWKGAPTSTTWTFKESSTKKYRFDYVIPDKVTAGWKTSATILSPDKDTDVKNTSDHAPVVATFTYP